MSAITGIRLSRRSFLVAGAIGVGAVAVGLGAWSEIASARSGRVSLGKGRVIEPNLWVSVAADDTVTVQHPAAEIGQGSRTIIPMILAEDMDADWSKVRAATAPYQAAYANPGFISNGSPRFVTADSTTTPGYWMALRIAGAQARRILLVNAARHFGVDVSSLVTEKGTVIHRPTGRRLTYGEIAAFASVPERMPEITEADLKPIANFRIIGTSPGRLDMEEKVRGAAVYGVDASMDNMLKASVLYPPLVGGEAGEIDDRRALAVPGVLKVVKLGEGVGVVAETAWAAARGREAIVVAWNNPARTAAYDSEETKAAFARIAADRSVVGIGHHRSGDIDAAQAQAARTLTADFASDHVTHACMEPMNATVHTHTFGKGAEIVSPTQSQDLDMRQAAKALKTPPLLIDVKPVYAGGGFGRRVDNRVVADAALLSREMGRPVKVVQQFGDDIRRGIYRALTAQHLEASIDGSGRIIGWRHRIVADSAYARMFPEQFDAAGGLDRTIVDGQVHLYGVPNQYLDYVRQDMGIPVGYLRSVGGGYTLWAIEQFLDRIAQATTKDPLAMRLELLSDPRARRVTEAVAEMAGWGDRPLGLAFTHYRGTYTAAVAELAEGDNIKVARMWATVDPGLAVHPGNVEAQIEGALIMGTSIALRECVPFAKGEAQVSNLSDYPVLRIDEAPEIAVKILQTPELGPQGVGESGVPAAAAAIANALLAARGREIGTLPLNRAKSWRVDRLKGATKV